jgi:hypothetical protein
VKKGRKKGKRARRRLDYRERDAILKEMGFTSYRAYLASPLWASIRERVMTRDRETCRLCPKPAAHVHHTRYDRATLEGRELKFLAAVCARCHRFVEFGAGGEKRAEGMVGETYRRARHRRKAAIWAESTDPLVAEFRAIVRG